MKRLVSGLVLIAALLFAGGLCCAEDLDESEFLAQFKRHDAELMKCFVLKGETVVPEHMLGPACKSGTRYSVCLAADGETTGSLTLLKVLPEDLHYIPGLCHVDYFHSPEQMSFWTCQKDVWLADANENRQARANQTALVSEHNKISLVDKVWVHLRKFPLAERERPGLRFHQTMLAAGRLVASDIEKIDELLFLGDGIYHVKAAGKHMGRLPCRFDLEVDVANGYLIRRGSLRCGSTIEITSEGTVRAGSATVAKSGTLRHGRDFEVTVKIDSLSLEAPAELAKVATELATLSKDPDRRVRDETSRPAIDEAYKDGNLEYRFEGDQMVAGTAFEQQELAKKRAQIKVTYRYIYIAGGEESGKADRPKRTIEEAKTIALKVRTELMEYRSRFAVLALLYSDYQNPNTGSFETTDIGSLAPFAAEAIGKMAPGSISEVIEAPHGCFLLETPAAAK